MDKCATVIDRMNMKLGSKFLSLLRNQAPAPKKASLATCDCFRWCHPSQEKDGAEAFLGQERHNK
jgi:hypothetical protein